MQPKLSIINYIKNNKLTPKDLDVKVNYLVDNFIVEQSLIMIFARAGHGKSFLVLALAKKLLEEQKISECIYLDMDNSTMALKNRSLDTIIESHSGLTYLHHSKIDVAPSELLRMLALESNIEIKSLDGYLVIVDSIRDFLSGRDMNSDRDVQPVLNHLKRLREAGATVIFLHHTNRDGDGTNYKGSSSFLDSIDVAYSLESNKLSTKELKYTLSVYKDRIPVSDTAFTLKTEQMALLEDNYNLGVLSEDDREFVEKALKLLNEEEGLNQNQLLAKMGTSSDNKTARKQLEKYTKEFWIVKSDRVSNYTKNYYPLKLAS